MWKVLQLFAAMFALCAWVAPVAWAGPKNPPRRTDMSVGSSFFVHRSISNLPSDGATPRAAARCTDAVYNRWLHNSWGMVLAKIWNHSHWCYSGTRITTATGWVDTYTAPGWDVSTATWTKAWLTKPYSMVTRARARFTLGIDGQHVQTFTPDACIQEDPGGTGRWC